MGVELTGNVYYSKGVTQSGTIENVTVPADATMAIVTGHGYGGGTSGPIDFDILNWDDDTDLHFTFIVKQLGTDKMGCCARYMLSNDGNWPGAGSGKTLTYSYDTDIYLDDSFTVLFFLKNVDLESPIIGEETTHSTNPWTSPDLGNVSADDMAIIAGSEYNTGPVDPEEGTGQTAIIVDSEGGTYIGIGYELGEDTPSISVPSPTACGWMAFAVKAGEGDIQIVMDALTVSGAVQDLLVSPGAVQLIMDALTISGATQNLSVSPGAVQLAMDVLIATGSTQPLTVFTSIVVVMDALTATASTQNLAIIPGAIQLPMDVLAAAGSAPSLSLMPGVVAIPLAVITASGEVLSFWVPTAGTPGIKDFEALKKIMIINASDLISEFEAHAIKKTINASDLISEFEARPIVTIFDALKKTTSLDSE